MVVRSDRRYWGSRVGGALVLGSGCVLASRSDSPLTVLSGLAGAAFFLPFAVYAMRQLLRRQPRLVLSREGVIAADAGVGLIAWEEIANVELFGSSEAPFIALTLHDAPRLLARMPWWPRLVARVLRAQGLQPLAINLMGVDRPATDIEKYARRCWRESRRASGRFVDAP